METLQKRFNIKATAAALEAAWIAGFNEKAIIAKTSWTTKEGLKRQVVSIQQRGLAFAGFHVGERECGKQEWA